jgi:hypothetical protein
MCSYDVIFIGTYFEVSFWSGFEEIMANRSTFDVFSSNRYLMIDVNDSGYKCIDNDRQTVYITRQRLSQLLFKARVLIPTNMKILWKGTKGLTTTLILLALFWTTAPTVVSSFLVPSQNHVHHMTTTNVPWKIRGGGNNNDDKISNGGGSILQKITSSSTAHQANLAQYADAASSLFSNMITPASILCGAIIPLCFASGLEYDGPDSETKFQKCTSIGKWKTAMDPISHIPQSSEKSFRSRRQHRWHPCWLPLPVLRLPSIN